MTSKPARSRGHTFRHSVWWPVQITVQDHVVIMSHFFDYLRTIAPAKK